MTFAESWIAWNDGSRNMNERKRRLFDKQVERVLARLPDDILRLLDEVPLHVEDRPSRRLRQELGVRNPRGLMGCFSGVPLDPIYRWSGNGRPTMMMIYRSGIIEAATDETGRVSLPVLREEIRKTILHELGHYHGMDEDELEEIGYG